MIALIASLFLTFGQAHKAIMASSPLDSYIAGCHRIEPTKIRCRVIEVEVSDPSEPQGVETIMTLEGNVIATLKHDHGKTYIRLHYGY